MKTRGGIQVSHCLVAAFMLPLECWNILAACWLRGNPGLGQPQRCTAMKHVLLAPGLCAGLSMALQLLQSPPGSASHGQAVGLSSSRAKIHFLWVLCGAIEGRQAPWREHAGGCQHGWGSRLAEVLLCTRPCTGYFKSKTKAGP